MAGSSDHPSESAASQGITRSLARYVVATQFEELPAAVRREALRSLLNWMGVAVGGSRHETIEIALAAIKPFVGAPQATLFGRAERLDVMHAALINKGDLPRLANYCMLDDWTFSNPRKITPPNEIMEILRSAW